MIPSQLRAGLSWNWAETLEDYPAPTWALTWYFTKSGAAFSITASGSGTEHTVAENAAATAPRAAGTYEVVGIVASGAHKHQVASGTVEILPALGSARDVRGWARRALDSLEAQIEADVPFDKVSVSLGGRQITFRTAREMIELRDYLKAQASLEEAAASNGYGRDIRVRFGR